MRPRAGYRLPPSARCGTIARMDTYRDFLSLGFCSNDHLAVLPFIPHDTKVRMLAHAIIGGGPAGNAAAGAAALGMSAAFAGTVGDDADGRQILADFARQGVDTSMIKVRPGATSAIAYLWIEEKTGARSCAWTREGLDELRADEIDAEAVAHAKILHLDGHNAAGAIAAAKVAREAGVLVNWDAGTHRDGVAELLPLADLLVCSAPRSTSRRSSTRRAAAISSTPPSPSGGARRATFWRASVSPPPRRRSSAAAFPAGRPPRPPARRSRRSFPRTSRGARSAGGARAARFRGAASPDPGGRCRGRRATSRREARRSSRCRG